MKPSFKLKLAVAAVLLAAAAGANAQLVNYSPPGTVGGSGGSQGSTGTLEIAIWDVTTQQAIVETLGMNIGTSTATASNVSIGAMTTTSATGGIEINFGQIGQSGSTNYFSTTFSNAINGVGGDSLSNLDWAVFAAGAAGSRGSAGNMFSTLSAIGTLPGNGTVSGATGAIGTWFTSYAPTSLQPTAGLYVMDNSQLTGSQLNTWALNTIGGIQFGGQLPTTFNNSAALTSAGSSLNFYQMNGTTVSAFSNGVSGDTRQGEFILSSTGSLEYLFPAGQSSVPIPAALWLLMSGLASVGLLGRRRNNAVDGAAA